MTKIIIVDYSLKIVIAIIKYDYHNYVVPLFEANACYIFSWKNAENTDWKTCIAFL